MQRSLALVLLATTSSACTAVQATYVRAGYDAKAQGAIKRIAVTGWSSDAHPALGPLLAEIVADRINLKMNYLVYTRGKQDRGWSDLCTDREGVISIRALAAVAEGDDMRLHLVGELHSCSNGELLWRSEGQEGQESGDEDLNTLVDSYAQKLGDDIRPYAAPAFLILRDMLATLPDPVLTDDEVMEKIELE